MASNALIHRLTSSIMSPPTFPDFVPENQALDCFALADMLEEGDRHEEATAYRWMGWWGDDLRRGSGPASKRRSSGIAKG